MKKQYYISRDLCAGCGVCAGNCPVGAVSLPEKKAVISRDCVGCGICARVCRLKAVEEEELEAEAEVCNACPIHCQVEPGRTGACRRYKNTGDTLQRIEPLHLVKKSEIRLDPLTGLPDRPLLLGLGAGTNLYSTNVPAKMIGQDNIQGVEVISCVTEAVLSFNGARVKVDTDENLGSNGSPVRREGVVVGYVNTSEYGSRMLYFGGAELNTGEGGFMVAKTVSDLLNKRPVTLRTDTVKKLILQQGHPPVVDGRKTLFMRVGCGSMVSSAFALHWMKVVDEVITIDYDITAKMSTHTTSGLRYGLRDSGITPVGRYSSPGRYFGEPGLGWGGSSVMEAKDAIKSIDKSKAWPGLRLLITEPTAERAAYFELDGECRPVEKPVPPEVESVLDLIRDNCEPCCCHVSVVAGFGGGVRNVISRVSPIKVNRALKEGKIQVSICGVPAHIWQGGGITAEADIREIPVGAFTWVPTPAGVVPVEMTMTKETYEEIGGYLDSVRPMEYIRKMAHVKQVSLENQRG